MSGCTRISDGCKNCYAERMAKRLHAMNMPGYEKMFTVTLHPDKIYQPLKWKKPQMIFVCSMGDLFHEKVPLTFIHEIFSVTSEAKHHYLGFNNKNHQWTHCPYDMINEMLDGATEITEEYN